MTAAVAVAPHPPDRATGGRTATRRNAELALLLMAMLLVTGFSVAAEAGVARELSLSALILPILITGLFLGAHVAVRVFAPYADPVILPAVAALNGISVVFIRRLDLGRIPPDDRAGAAIMDGQAFRQLIWAVVAVAGFVALLALVRDHRILARFGYTAGLVGIVLVMIPAVLPGRFSEINGAKLWIIVPGLGQIQPGEFAKLALMIFFGSYLVTKRDVLSLASRRFLGLLMPRGRDLGPVVAVWVASLLVLIFEKDLGTSLMYFGIFVVMLYIATERTSWLLIGLLLFAGGAYLASLLVERVKLRVDIWLDPFADAFGDGYQLVQSLFSLGTGGMFGTGPGAGNPTLLDVGSDYASTDFVVAALGEEIGLYGLTAMLLIYALVASRGMRAALDVRDSFGKLLAGGLAFSLGLQVFVIVGGVSRLIPLTGLTTPFLSYGGSSLIANWLIVGLLMRISDAGRKPAAVKMPALQLRDAPTEVVRL
ncbi:MAG TPA: FtsW/RodA/SpoVE family cell cycle protein [Cryptosporangiaceae bacterium]|nr:FtsW/RodA/SpoVE family cell cycle protein [Cryptosporangiaceae bacterium]